MPLRGTAMVPTCRGGVQFLRLMIILFLKPQRHCLQCSAAQAKGPARPPCSERSVRLIVAQGLQPIGDARKAARKNLIQIIRTAA